MTDRTWYLINAAKPLLHPFKVNRGNPLPIKEGEWFTSEKPFSQLSDSDLKSKTENDLIETQKAWKPTMEQCLLEKYGTFCDIWPAYKVGSNIYETTIVLDDETFERYEFINPEESIIGKWPYQTHAKGIGIFGARWNDNGDAKPIDPEDIVKIVSATSSKIVLKFQSKVSDPESVVGFDFYLRPKNAPNNIPWRLVIDPVIRNNGGDPGGDGG